MIDIEIKHFASTQHYTPILLAMQQYIKKRALLKSTHTKDELWLLEHYPVFTQGVAGKMEHIHNTHNIPLIHSDRGGQVTYHGPGQLMLYILSDLNKLNLNIHKFVLTLANSIIRYLKTLMIDAEYKITAPGVYINGDKIASIGLRVRHGLSYHGVAFNINMDLTPFNYINSCGIKGLRMTQLSHFISCNIPTVKEQLVPIFCQEFGYSIIGNNYEQ